jgi:hypothetical protein
LWIKPGRVSAVRQKKIRHLNGMKHSQQQQQHPVTRPPLLPGLLCLGALLLGGTAPGGATENPLSDLDTPAVQLYVLPEEQPDFDVPLFLEEEGGSPRLELIPGSTRHTGDEELQARKDREMLEDFLSTPPQAAPAAPVQPAAPEPPDPAGEFEPMAADDQGAPVKLVFSVPEYLREMGDAMAALSLQSIMTTFMIFNTTARLYEEGLYTREEALRVTETYLHFLKVSGRKLKRLHQREVERGASPTSPFLLAMRELHEQGAALQSWILSGGYTPDPAYGQAEEEARLAIRQIVGPDYQLNPTPTPTPITPRSRPRTAQKAIKLG